MTTANAKANDRTSSADGSRSCVDGPPARPRYVAPGPRMTRSPATQGRYGVDRCQAGDTDRRRHPLISPDTRPLSPNQLPNQPASVEVGWSHYGRSLRAEI